MLSHQGIPMIIYHHPLVARYAQTSPDVKRVQKQLAAMDGPGVHPETDVGGHRW
jgi:hypothetical protein